MSDLYQDYAPNDAIVQALGTKNLLTFVGPAGVGKSTVLDAVTKRDNRFGRTGSLTTRPPESRDIPGMMQYLSHKEFDRQIKSGDVVNVTMFPTTGHLYGTNLAMYRHEFNMLEALPASIDYFQRLPFKLFKTMSLVTDSGAWQEWFLQRYPTDTPERQKRLKEAAMNLEWSLSQNVTWVYNQPGEAEATARTIIDIVEHGRADDDGRAAAEAMLTRANKLIGL